MVKVFSYEKPWYKKRVYKSHTEPSKYLAVASTVVFNCVKWHGPLTNSVTAFQSSFSYRIQQSSKSYKFLIQEKHVRELITQKSCCTKFLVWKKSTYQTLIGCPNWLLCVSVCHIELMSVSQDSEKLMSHNSKYMTGSCCWFRSMLWAHWVCVHVKVSW